MENRAHALAAGFFTLVLGAALAAVSLWFGKEELRLRPFILTTTSSVTGLKVEAPVRYRGVDVGKVEQIKIDPSNAGRVQIRIGVQEDTPITAGTYAQLGFQGITGIAYVQLTEDGKSTRQLIAKSNEPQQIRMKPSLMDDGENLLAMFAEIAEKVGSLLGKENQQSVSRTLAGLEEVTQRANAVSRKLEPSLNAMPALIGETRGLAADARASVKKADQMMTSVNGLALKLEERVDTLNRVGATADEVAVTARSLNDDTVPRMNALADDLSRESRSIGRVVSNLGDQPQSVVFGVPPGKPGPGEPGFSGGK
jgi:phospholipid/cholesterol/gamma-HCH transport system substrate-binding protein